MSVIILFELLFNVQVNQFWSLRDGFLVVPITLYFAQGHNSMPHDYQTRPRGYKAFSMLNSAEQEIYPAHKC